MDRTNDIEIRIREALSDQDDSQYSPILNDVARVFLDLSLEYQDPADFCRMAVMMLKVILDWDASIYLAENDSDARLYASSRPELRERLSGGERLVTGLIQDEEHQSEEGRYLVPLKHHTMQPNQSNELNLGPVVGLLSVQPRSDLNEDELPFVRKYADIVAMNIVQRMLAQRNQQHIDFIRKLVADIGHNVIVPNIFFKAYLRRLAGKIKHLRYVQWELNDLTKAPPQTLPQAVRDMAAELTIANEGLQEEFDHIEKHYHNTSLFLETLLRQSHFDKGQYVLQKKTCNFRRDIIAPQVERYEPRLKEKGIEIDLSMGGVPDEIIEAVVDVGLISQVFANLISNAIKYTRPVMQDGRERKYISYGLEYVPDAFGNGSPGVKLNLFSTGTPLAEEDARRIFDDGFRGSNVGAERGTGHGLLFVKDVVELHGGRAGYESTPMGNNFYFILPK